MLLWEKLVISLCWRLSTDTKLGHRRAALCHHIDSSGGADGLSCAPKCTGSKRQLSDLSTAIVTALQGQEQRREPLNEFKGRQSSGEREKANRKRVGTGDAHLGALHRAAPRISILSTVFPFMGLQHVLAPSRNFSRAPGTLVQLQNHRMGGLGRSSEITQHPPTAVPSCRDVSSVSELWCFPNRGLCWFPSTSTSPLTRTSSSISWLLS